MLRGKRYFRSLRYFIVIAVGLCATIIVYHTAVGADQCLEGVCRDTGKSRHHSHVFASHSESIGGIRGNQSADGNDIIDIPAFEPITVVRNCRECDCATRRELGEITVGLCDTVIVYHTAF